MKKYILFSLLFSLACLMWQCKDKPTDEVPPTPAPTTEIFVAGYEAGLHKYWKNGVATTLSTSNPAALQQGMAVVGNDVYVAGSQINATNKYVATYWKNGVATSLTNGTNSGFATSIAVVGNDVYVAGFERNASGIDQAKFWKNGTVTQLATVSSKANAIFATNGNVYIAGYQVSSITGRPQPTFWTINSSGNITPTTLPININQGAQFYDIKVLGNDIYVAGYETNGLIDVAKLWKGTGGSFTITEVHNTTSSQVNAIAILNNEVYMAGRAYNTAGTKTVAKYWKSTTQGITGTDLTDGVDNAEANGIFVLGADFKGNSSTKYWKNGVATTLATGSPAKASAIFVR